MDMFQLILQWILGVPIWLVGICGLFLAFYLYSTWKFSIFKELGFPYDKPVPFLGTSLRVFQVGVHAMDIERGERFKGKCYGSFFGSTPQLVLNNSESLKQVCIKDFRVAPNHWRMGMRGLLESSIFDARNERWHNQRAALTPAFTGSKLRQMTPWILSVADNLANDLKQKAEKKESFEMKERAGLMTMDVVAGTGFGIDTNSFSNEKNEFIRVSKALYTFSLASPVFLIIMFFRFLIPLMEFLGINMFRKWIEKYYDGIIGEAIKLRKKEQDEDDTTKRTDLLQQMVSRLVETPTDKSMERTDRTGVWYEKGFTEKEIKGNGMLLLLAGFDTTATAVSFLCYNLAVHPEVQDRVIEEIDSVLQGEAPDYDSVGKLPYLDQCLAESLRLFPPAIRTDRQVEKATVIDGHPVPVGMLLAIPIYAIHHDPEYWPEPDKFDPERFSPENRPVKDDFRYLPFGIGPRMCIAKRLGELEIKIAVARLLQTVRLTTCEKTEIPITLAKHGFMQSKDGIHLKAELRE